MEHFPGVSTKSRHSSDKSGRRPHPFSEQGAAPRPRTGPVPLTLGPVRRRVRCPRCGSADTAELSRFSATACKALYRCNACHEPFEHFKEL